MTRATEELYKCALYADDSFNGLAALTGSLLQENFENFPERRKTAAKIARPIALRESSSRTACTVLFGSDKALLLNDIAGQPSVTVIDTTGDQLLAVSQLRMRAGGLLPTGFFTKQGVSVIRAILRKELIVKGLITHPITVLRLIALMSVA
ncbi:hypothetical protein OIE68_01165 [Nocardia vinacea]|uniref:hypothetical protein n=1 Tax=Nocardia vinacea TaxID=96468 RepID=UPI002E11506C|nr:hypothetical protein OIE68_01165 [Nocardia vinacea]